MQDKKAILSFIVLGLNVSVYNFYLYELFYGSWEERQAKGMFDIITVIILGYLAFDTIKGYSTYLHLQANICIFSALMVNFLLFAFTLYDILPGHRLYLYTFNGTVLASTITILILGHIYETFKL